MQAWEEINQQWQDLIQRWAQIYLPTPPEQPTLKQTSQQPCNGFDQEWLRSLLSIDRNTWHRLNTEYQQKLGLLYQRMGERKPGDAMQPVIEPEHGDRRFKSHEWRDYPFYDWIKQNYLLYAQYWSQLLEQVELSPVSKQKLVFYIGRYLDAIAPSNNLLTNPEAIKLALASNGESIQRGLHNLLEDMRRGRIAMSDPEAFRVGGNLAITPGAVIFRNELIELIQYHPQTAKVYARPLLIIPPCINKYYILDLQPENSFANYAVQQGYAVFMISWRNIPTELGSLTWDDYLQRGVLQAVAIAKAVTNSKKINTLGFCVGGTLLACALAVLAAKRDSSIASATLLTTMLDFSEPGEIGVYLDEAHLQTREPILAGGGRIQGSELANAFASLRANELVWAFVIRNYLQGQVPPAFDLLYWNGDSANLPGPMYVYYLRNMYLENKLMLSGKLTMCGEVIDLRKIKQPTYVLATKEDHIVPWRSAYQTVTLLGGDIEFVLGASGHIAGVVNPAAKNKRNYWTNLALPQSADDWFDKADEHQGSWWPHWHKWLAQYSGQNRSTARRLGNTDYPELCPAPGTYVLEQDC